MKKISIILLMMTVLGMHAQTVQDSIFTVNGVSFKMVYVEGGSFEMGANNSEKNEIPAHDVTLSSYMIGETEVTQELWQMVMGNNPSRFKGEIHRPIEQVSWEDCQKFVAKLNDLTGKRFRLPTEAEWEFAARGGIKSNGYKYAGSNILNDVAWYNDNAYLIGSGNTGYGTHPVGTKSANELGLYDMNGNVLEWCNDWYDDYNSFTQTNPKGPLYGILRVVRGGCWCDTDNYCCISNRIGYLPDYKLYHFGLRLVMDLDNDNMRDNSVLPSFVQSSEFYRTFTVSGVSFTMVYVKGGEFMMGATSEQGNNSEGWDKPVHRVFLDDYMIGQTEVTQELWAKVMGVQSMSFSSHSYRPMEEISWNECQHFIAKLNVLTGEKFRLPTEAEWEFAARGGMKSKGYKYSGSNNLDDVAWYYQNSGISFLSEWDEDSVIENCCSSHYVGTKIPNELGIYDMSGNVSEWCNDWFDDKYYSISPVNNPQGPSCGEYRVIRGCGWYNKLKYCNISFRGFMEPNDSAYSIGFRLAL